MTNGCCIKCFFINSPPIFRNEVVLHSSSQDKPLALELTLSDVMGYESPCPRTQGLLWTSITLPTQQPSSPCSCRQLGGRGELSCATTPVFQVTSLWTFYISLTTRPSRFTRKEKHFLVKPQRWLLKIAGTLIWNNYKMNRYKLANASFFFHVYSRMANFIIFQMTVINSAIVTAGNLHGISSQHQLLSLSQQSKLGFILLKHTHIGVSSESQQVLYTFQSRHCCAYFFVHLSVKALLCLFLCPSFSQGTAVPVPFIFQANPKHKLDRRWGVGCVLL